MDQTIYGGQYGNATRAVGLAFNLCKLGHKVFLEVEDEFEDRTASDHGFDFPQFIRASERSNILSKTDRLLISCTNIESFKRLSNREPYLEHPCRVIVSCFDLGQKIEWERFAESTKAITFNNNQQKLRWDKRKSGVDAYVVPYGVNEHEYVDEAIVDVQRPSALWIGEIRRNDMLERIVKFAKANPTAHVTIVARKIYDCGIPDEKRGGRLAPFGDFRDGKDPLSKFDHIVKQICREPKPKNIEFLGPVEGENHVIQGRNLVGLDFSRFPAQEHDNTKILDYLRSGMCVICDRGTPSCRFVEETGHGVIVEPEFSEIEIQDAFARCIEIGSLSRRMKVARYVREKYGWNSIASQISDILQKVHSSTRLSIADTFFKKLKR
ncbi:MAG TPA: hypothetical protein DDZ51_00405 [Planctomycetaceae bacterium]|nr:hypothetical protein [Planctomycetaceae bacterium]